MIKLTDDEKDFIRSNKDILRKNDIAGFCREANRYLRGEGTVGRIMQFLIENKVDVFNYLEVIPDNMFKEAEFDSITIPDHITKIGSNSFANCKNLTSVTIGDSVKTIGDNAFSGCTNLRQLYLPNSVRILGSSVFQGDENLIIYAEKREPGTRLKCKKKDIEWFKEHLFRKEEPEDEQEESTIE